MRKSLFILLGCLLIAPMCRGQVLPFRTYSIEQGLSEAVVNDLMQDGEGYIWVATGYGLNKFDGIRFQKFYEEDGLLNNKVYSLLEDASGTVWVGTGGGVNVISGDSIRTHPALQPLRSSTILEIFQDQNGEYWFATDGQGVWHLDRADNLTQYSTVNGLANNRVRDVVETPEGTLWFGTRGGLTSLKEGSFRTYTQASGLADDRIRDLQLSQEGDTLWVGTRGGLSRFINGQFKNFTEVDGLVNNRIQSISRGRGGSLWLGTEEGASHFMDGTFQNYTTDEGLPNNIIHATLWDREQNIWFGTFGGGFSLFLGDHFKNYTTEQGLPNGVITSITQDSAGAHWIATYGGGIARLHNGRFEVFDEERGLVDNKVYTTMFDEHGRLLIGTRWGLSIFEDGIFRNYDETELPYRKIRALEQPRDGGYYWLGTYGEGIVRLENENTFSLYTEEDGLANNTVMAVEQAPDGSFWFATYGGVSRFQEGAFTNYTIRDGLPNNGVLDIEISADGALWFATFGGVAKYENGTFETFTAEDGLQDEVCYFIIQDEQGRFWIGTNKGVIRFDYRRFKQADSSLERSTAFKLYTQNQGLVANEMNAGAGFTDRQGELWFGTVNGLTHLNPAALDENRVPPIIHIEDVIVSGQPVQHRRGVLEVGSDEHNVRFEFIGISFSAPDQVIYEYRLRNSGESWQQTRERQVRYTALPPGDYTFQVRARNNAGFWSTQTAELSFTVLAPFWMQWWFLLLMLLVLAGIIYFFYHYYRMRKMMEMERMRVRIASDLHDDVGSSLTEIALQSDFLQTTNAPEELKESVQSIGAQSRRIVSSLDDIVWSIDARNDTLGDLTDRMQDYINNILSGREVVYHFDDLNMDKKLSVPVKENLYLIFKEAVNNIAKHSDADHVEVHLTTDGNSFNLKIDDNGTNVSNARKTGHGLRNMKMRAKRINASINFENEDGFTVHVHGKHE